MTALHRAACYGQIKTAKQLLGVAGNDKLKLLMQKDNHGLTAFDVAKNWSKQELVTFFNDLQTALEAGNEQCVQKLLTIQPEENQ